MVVVTVRLPEGLVAEMDALVEGSGYLYRDRSELIRQTMAQRVNGERPNTVFEAEKYILKDSPLPEHRPPSRRFKPDGVTIITKDDVPPNLQRELRKKGYVVR